MDIAIKKMKDRTNAIYDDFDGFIEHDMNNVVIVNNFHEHSKYVIKWNLYHL